VNKHDVAHIVVHDFGGSPVAEHNMPCAVCRERKAVYHLNYGWFDPCWTCQQAGWRLELYPKTAWGRLLKWAHDKTDRFNR